MAKVEYQDEGWNDLIVELEFASIEAAKIAVKGAVDLLRNALVEKVSGTRTGRIYRIPGRKVKYQASAPGEPPAIMEENLRKNINASNASVEGNEVRAEVGVDLNVVPYARRLEFGGFSTAANGARVYVAPRPYFRPTFLEQEANVDALLQREAGSR
jgi:hypothetical protein